MVDPSMTLRQNDPSRPLHDKAPKVTVGMPVFNGADTIEKAIAAVLAQTFADLELVISDNASTDGTLKLCQAGNP